MRWPLAVVLPFLALPGCGQFGLEPIDPAIDGRLTITPQATTNFGELMPGEESKFENFVLAPQGQENPIDVEDVWLEGDTGAFTIGVEPSVPRRLNPGQQFGVRVRFRPSRAGAYSANFVAVTGTGEEVRRTMRGDGCKDRDDNDRCD